MHNSSLLQPLHRDSDQPLESRFQRCFEIVGQSPHRALHELDRYEGREPVDVVQQITKSVPVAQNQVRVKLDAVKLVFFVESEYAEAEGDASHCGWSGGHHAEKEVEHAAKVVFVEWLEGMSG